MKRTVVAPPERVEGITFTDESKAKQEFKQECDINFIVRYGLTPVERPMLFEDFSVLPDIVESANQIAKAKSDFEQLPSNVRKEFDNDVMKFLDEASNPENAESLMKKGIDIYKFAEQQQKKAVDDYNINKEAANTAKQPEGTPDN